MWDLLASEIDFEIVPIAELRKYLRKSNVIVVDIKILDTERVMVFFKE